ncbi:MAG TPA: hypothetical protein VFL30_10345, partial [Rhodanobacteraceae bacterium]|nr:hypothetical protein [Rhodanobacteraceae bacterium]
MIVLLLIAACASEAPRPPTSSESGSAGSASTSPPAEAPHPIPKDKPPAGSLPKAKRPPSGGVSVGVARGGFGGGSGDHKKGPTAAAELPSPKYKIVDVLYATDR